MANEFKVKNGLISPNVIFQGSTSGTATVAAPAVAGTASITLPGASGTLATLAGTETLTNKTLTSPTVSGLYLSDSSIIFEGSSADDSETTLTVTNPTADRTITIPDATGTITLSSSALTSGRVPYATTGGALTDSSYLLFNSGTGALTAQHLVANSTISGGSATITELDTLETTFNLVNDTAETINFGGAATTLTLGYTGTAASTTNISTGAVANGTTRTINIGTGGAVGNITNINLGSSNGFDGVIQTYRQLNVNSSYGSLQMFGANSFNISGTSELRLVSSGTNGFVIGSVGNAAPVVLAVNSTEVLRVSSNNVKVKQIFTLDFGTVLGGIQTGLEIKGDAAYATNLRFKIAQNTGGENIGSPVGTFSGAIIDVEGDRALSIATNSTERIHIQGDGIVNIRASTASSSSTTGALIVAGGVGIGGNLNVGYEIVGGRIRTNDIEIVGNRIRTTQSNSNFEIDTVGAGSIELLADTNITGTVTATNLTVTNNATFQNITVNGTTTTLNSTTITVDDKNLELGSVSTLTITGSITATTTTTTVTGITSTTGLIPGMVLAKTSGAGAFGGATTITSIDSATQITITSTTANTVGSITFTASGPSASTANGGGITLKGDTDKTIIWDSANTNWTSSEHWNLPTGKEFKINNTTVLTSTQVLGKSLPAGTILGTSDTQTLTNKSLSDSTTYFIDDADGTKKMQFELSSIATATTRTLTVPNVNGTIVTTGDTGTVTNGMLAGSIAAGKLTLSSANIIVGNGSNVGAAVAMSGDITIDNTGATAIGATKVTNAMLAGSIALSKLTSDTSTALGVGTLELGHASDTTLSRSSAGVLAVEGVVVPTVSSTNTLTNKTLTSPTLSLPKFDISAAVSAAGSTQGTATALTTMINNVTTVAASSGVALPTAVAGYIVIVRNGGANALNVYPAAGASINAGADNAAHSLPVGAMIQYVATSTTKWYTMSSTFA